MALTLVFIMLYKLVLTFKSVDETLVCDHSNESYWAELVPSSDTTYRQWWTLLYQVPHNLQVPVDPLGNLIINSEH